MSRSRWRRASILRRQLERAAALGPRTRRWAASSSSTSSTRTYRECALARRWRELGQERGLHRGLSRALGHVRRAGDRLRSARLVDASGVPVEFSKGEWGRGPARDQPALRRRRSRWPTATSIYKHGREGDRRGTAATGDHLHGEVGRARWPAAALHVHTSHGEAADGSPALPGRTSRCAGTPAHGLRYVSLLALGGLLAHVRELALLLAPNPNSATSATSPGTFAPTRRGLELGQPDCGLPRSWVSGASLRIECRIPGADANPYLVYAANAGRGAGRHRAPSLDPGESAFAGDVYGAEDLPQRGRAAWARPSPLLEASRLRPGRLWRRGGRAPTCTSRARRQAVFEHEVVSDVEREPLLRAGVRLFRNTRATANRFARPCLRDDRVRARVRTVWSCTSRRSADGARWGGARRDGARALGVSAANGTRSLPGAHAVRLKQDPSASTSRATSSSVSSTHANLIERRRLRRDRRRPSTLRESRARRAGARAACGKSDHAGRRRDRPRALARSMAQMGARRRRGCRRAVRRRQGVRRCARQLRAAAHGGRGRGAVAARGPCEDAAAPRRAPARVRRAREHRRAATRSKAGITRNLSQNRECSSRRVAPANRCRSARPSRLAMRQPARPAKSMEIDGTGRAPRRRHRRRAV